MAKVIITIIMIVMILGVLVACGLEENEMNITRDKIFYALDMHFTWQIVIDGETTIITVKESRVPVLDQILPIGVNPQYTDLVFVHSEEEAVGFPDSTVVAWPLRLEDRDVAQGIVNGLHFAALLGEVDLENFDLSYPLTVENLVDDWRAVNNFLTYLSDNNLWSGFGSVLQYGADAFLDSIEELRRDRD